MDVNDGSISRYEFLRKAENGIPCPWSPCLGDRDSGDSICKPLGKAVFQTGLANGFRFYKLRSNFKLAFDYFDEDCDGRWSNDDLETMIHTLDIQSRGKISNKEALTTLLINEWLEQRDENGDGYISYQEYVDVGKSEASAQIAGELFDFFWSCG